MRSNRLQHALSRRAFAVGAASSVLAITTRGLLGAQESSPEPGTGVSPEVLLTGLTDPRFVAVDGTEIYFTEAGTGGDTAIYPVAEAGTPEATVPESFAGHTGKVSCLSADGTITTIASDLLSYTFGDSGEINGPAGLAIDGSGAVYVAMSTGPSMHPDHLTGEEGVLLKIDIASGEQTILADLVEWELTHNPDPMEVFSNPFGMTLVNGTAYIADAAANAIIAVDVETGEMSTFAVTGGVPVDFFPEAGNPSRDGAQEIDSVPSSVKPGPDGRLYVSYVTGGPFPPGAAPIDAFSLDGEMERVVEGLTMTADLAFDSAGRLYASIMSTDMINGGPGQIVRIEDDGSITVVIDGLAMPAGIAFDADDNLYVINKSTVVPGGGELLRYTGVTEVPAGTTGSDAGTVATPEPETGAVGGDTFHIDFIDTAFEPNELTIPANTDVTLTFENKGYLAHDFAIKKPKYISDVLGNGGTATLVVNLEPGEYQFYCSQIGHKSMGMVGTLTVE